jgi:hypothetical protein
MRRLSSSKMRFARARAAALSGLAVAACVGSLVGVTGAADASSSGVTLSASPLQIGFGATVTLKGHASGGELVKLLSQPCGFTGLVQVAAKTAGRDGSYAFRVDPTLKTRFLAQAGTAHSNSVTVRVQPAIAVTKLATGRFSIVVSAGNGHFFTGEKLPLQTRSSSSQGWRTVGTGLLGAASRVDELIALSKATVVAAVPAGGQVRAEFPAAAAGACFLASVSPTVTG